MQKEKHSQAFHRARLTPINQATNNPKTPNDLMKTRPLLLHLLLAFCSAISMAGTPDKSAAPVQPKPPENPLSFFDGRLVIDFEERARFEARNNNYDFNDQTKTVNDSAWLLQRARLGIKFAPTDFLTFYAQGQSAFEFGGARPKVPGQLGAEGDNQIDLFQAYVKVGDQHFNATIGRQTLVYGDERLVGAFDWNNLGRSFDAVKIHYGTDTWNIEAFASSVVVQQRDVFDHSDLFDGNDTGRNEVFSGLYFTSTGLIPVQTTDLYVFELHEEFKSGDTDFVTLGSRMKGDPKKLGGFDYETEMAAEFGDVKGKDLTAFAGHWGAGYNWLASPWKPRAGIEYNYATGDGNATDGKVGTFQNLFPTNHPFYGTADFFSWQNIHNPAVSVSVLPTEKLKVKLDYHLFWLADTHDAWYRANGVTQVRPIHANADNFVGSEIDLNASWKVTKNITLGAGYSHFFDGDYAKASGAASDADFVYAQVSIKF